MSIRLWYIRPPVISFPNDNLSKCQLIFTKLDVCTDIVRIWFGIVYRQISFYTIFSLQHFKQLIFNLTLLFCIIHTRVFYNNILENGVRRVIPVRCLFFFLFFFFFLFVYDMLLILKKKKSLSFVLYFFFFFFCIFLPNAFKKTHILFN